MIHFLWIENAKMPYESASLRSFQSFAKPFVDSVAPASEATLWRNRSFLLEYQTSQGTN